MMKLTELPGIIKNLVIARNTEFNTLGLINSNDHLQLSFLYDESYLPRLIANKNIVAVLTTAQFADKIPQNIGLCISENPIHDFVYLHNFLSLQTEFYHKKIDTVISPTANIHPGAHIAKTNVRIGDGATIEAGAHVLENSIIGKNSYIYANAIIGAEDTHAFMLCGRHVGLKHAGGVVIGDRTEIKYGCIIGKSIFKGNTIIGNDIIIDKLSSISHECIIGDRTRIAACANISGSVIVGEDAYIGPSAVISNALTIGDGARITIGSVVARSVKDNEHVTGNFALPHQEFLAGKRAPKIRI